MVDTSMFVGNILGVVCQLTVGSLIGAVILRAACSLYNKLAGASPPGNFRYEPHAAEQPQYTTAETGPYAPPTAVGEYAHGGYAGKSGEGRGVPEPDFGRAWLMMFLVILAQGAVGFALGLVVGLIFTAQAQAGEPTPLIISGVLSLLITIPVMAGILAGMLPTSFGRALLVTLLHMAIGIAVAIAIVVMIAILALVLGGGFAAFGAVIAV